MARRRQGGKDADPLLPPSPVETAGSCPTATASDETRLPVASPRRRELHDGTTAAACLVVAVPLSYVPCGRSFAVQAYKVLYSDCWSCIAQRESAKPPADVSSCCLTTEPPLPQFTGQRRAFALY